MYPLVVAARAAPVVTLRPERSIWGRSVRDTGAGLFGTEGAGAFKNYHGRRQYKKETEGGHEWTPITRT